MSRRLSLSSISLLLAGALCGAAGAAELGEAKVSSHIGQQLVADIELTAFEDAATAVQVRLASADVYRGAGLELPPVLGSLHMSVMRRDGRQFLHITSLKPVESDRLHLFLELADGGQRVVRQATLWFTPDPTPPAPVAAREALPGQVAKPEHKAPARQAAFVPLRQASLQAQACRAQESSSEALACVALEGRNAALRAQVDTLEGRVRVLQTALVTGGGTEKPGAGARPAPARAALPPAPASVQEVPRPGLPWGWIGGAGAAVFAIVGAVLALRSRRAKSAAADAPAEPTLE